MKKRHAAFDPSGLDASVWLIVFGFAASVSAQIRPRAVRIICGVNGILVIVVPNGLSASLTALATAAAAPAVPASPAPFAPNSVSDVGDTTCPTSISAFHRTSEPDNLPYWRW
jgi:septal ring-binding cell division protein DamX